MKKIVSIILASFLILAVFVTPAFAAVGDNSFTEYESNDSTSTADRIYNDYSVNGTIAYQYDMDYFKFTLSSSSKVNLLCISSKSVIMVGIADSSGDLIAAAQPFYEDGYYYDAYTDTLPAGTYYIVVLADECSYTNITYMFYFEYESATHTHSYSSSVVSPTCTQQGYTVYTCSCGYSYNGNYTSARGHSFGSWTITKPATCTSTGTKKRVCNTCGYSETETIAKTSHIASDWIVDEEATSSTTGSQHKECTTCGEILETQTIDKISHTISDWIIEQEATCTEDGFKYKECTVCGDVIETETLYATGHVESDWIIADGYQYIECVNCGELLETEAIEPVYCDCAFTNYVYNNDATTYRDGTKTAYCDNGCGEMRTLRAIGTALNPIIIDIYPGETKKVSLAPETAVIYKIHSTDNLTEGYWFSLKYPEELTPETIKNYYADNSPIDWDEYNAEVPIEWEEYYDVESYGFLDGGMGDIFEGEEKFSPHISKAGQVYYIEVVSKYDEPIDISLSMSGSYDIANPEATHTVSTWKITEEATVYSAGEKVGECTECGATVKEEIPQLKCSKPTLENVRNATNGVRIVWSKVKGADSYNIYRRTKSGSYCLIGTTEKSYFDDESAVSGKRYYYSVKAVNEAGESAYSSADSIYHLATPTLTKICNATGGLKITWSKVSGAEGYYIYRKLYGAEEWTKIATIKDNSTVSYKDTKVSEGKVYVYTVKAFDGKRKSSIDSDGIWLRYLKKPTLKTISNTGNGVKITWDEITKAEKYNVYRRVSNSEYKYIGSTTNTYYTDKTATSGKKYYYTIRAQKGETVSYISNTLSKYYLEDPTLNTPSSTKSGVKLSWSEVTGAQGYIIYRKTGSGSYTKLKTEKGVTNLSYIDSSAKKGTKYTYKVKAYYSKTYSAYSNTKAITDKY